MPTMPRDPHLDSTLGLFREGYEFVSGRCRRLGTDAFLGRFLAYPVICTTGAEAAREFYDAERYERAGVVPARIQATLIGAGGVQGLDGTEHLNRKDVFMNLMNRDSIEALVQSTARFWNKALAQSAQQGEMNVFECAQVALCRGVCAWAGVPLPNFEVARRTHDLVAMVDGFGAIGPRHWRGRWARSRSEYWIRSLIERVRTRTFTAPKDSVLDAWTWHRDETGTLLPSKVAAVELLNVLRPTVAVAYYVAFAAAALVTRPEYRRRIAAGEPGLEEAFAHEVRRFYPFAPFVGARTRQAFDSTTGYRFPEGHLVLLDIYGTNRDPRIWHEPDRFNPERFLRRSVGAFDYIPQGGGHPDSGHRCAGEPVTTALLQQAVSAVSRCMDFTVPQQDLSFSLTRIPTYPRSGVRLAKVRQTADVADAVLEPLGKQACRAHRR
jgi:fatty-acid peroxygenase